MISPPLFEPAGPEMFRCLLCPHHCILSSGMRGLCKVRTADSTGIHSVARPVTVMAVDPIEKKPFYHFLPGSRTLSLGFAGCNLKCPFCQNHSLVDTRVYNENISPTRILEEALRLKLPSVSFTYSEPLIHIEFLSATASLLKQNGVSPLLITNGCINPEPGRWLLSHMDGVKVDLKCFDSEWYKRELGGDLEAVKSFISAASDITHLEVVTLVIPGKNDSEEEIERASDFIAGFNPDIPYHLTAYYPQHRYRLPPTTAEHLARLKSVAETKLNHVYTGNTGSVEDTMCGGCGSLLINRYNGTVDISSEGACQKCGKTVYGHFSG